MAGITKDGVWGVLKLALILLATWQSCSASAVLQTQQHEQQKQPNILFILADDVGWNDVSWNNDGVITPHLQELMETGVHLDYNYVQPVCTPSRSALMSGFYPYHLGRQTGVILDQMPTGLDINKVLLPQRLKHLGYSTHLVGKWHLGFCDLAYTPTYRGFDSFYGFYGAQETHFTHFNGGGYDFRDGVDVDLEANGTYATFLFADRGVKILEEQQSADKPFFLYMAFQNPHTPLEVPPEYLDLYPEVLFAPRKTYLGMMSAMDEAVGRLVATLKATGHYEDTIIVFSSDNGAAIQLNGGSNDPLRGQKGTVFEGGTRVPAFIHSPLLESTPRTYNGLFHITDWFSTLLTAAGAEHLPDGVDAVDQWEAIRTGTENLAPREGFIYNLQENANGIVLGAIRSGSYKLILLDQDEGEGAGRSALYNIDEDPNETTDLVEEMPLLAAELEALLLKELESLVPNDNPPNAEEGDPANWGGIWTPGWCEAH